MFWYLSFFLWATRGWLIAEINKFGGTKVLLLGARCFWVLKPLVFFDCEAARDWFFFFPTAIVKSLLELHSQRTRRTAGYLKDRISSCFRKRFLLRRFIECSKWKTMTKFVVCLVLFSTSSDRRLSFKTVTAYAVPIQENSERYPSFACIFGDDHLSAFYCWQRTSKWPGLSAKGACGRSCCFVRALTLLARSSCTTGQETKG